MTLGSAIRKARIEKDISIKQLAQKICVSDAFISRLERDDVKPPKEEKIILMANILGLESDYLLSLAKKIPKEITKDLSENPKYVSFFRTVKRLNEQDFDELMKTAEQKITE